MDKNSEEFKKAAAEAVRTIPGREHGGNCDIKNLTRGCKVDGHDANMVWTFLLLCKVGAQTASAKDIGSKAM